MTDSTGIHDFKAIRSPKPSPDGLIELPVIPLGDMVIYPDIISPLFVPHAALPLVKAALETRQTVSLAA